MLNTFANALQGTNLVELTFKSNNQGIITRTCAPMDYGPWRHTGTGELRYHFIDIDSTDGMHPLSIQEEKIVTLRMLEEKFEPANLITWTPDWHIVRDWGVYS